MRSIIAAAGLLASIIVTPAEAVDRLVPSQFATIQQAIDVAQAGDVVLVAAGSHAGPIDTKGKAITVRGAADASMVIVSGGGAGVLRCVTSETSATVIENLTLTNGIGGLGGGIRCTNSSPTIRNCRVIGNTMTSGDGGGVYVSGGSPLFTGCLIAANKFTHSGRGAGVFVKDSSARFEGCNITGNSVFAPYQYTLCPSGRGGGVYTEGSNTVVFVDCEIASNILQVPAPGCGDAHCAANGGVAMYLSSPAELTRCVIRFNWDYGCGNTLVHCVTPQVFVKDTQACGNWANGFWGPFVDLGGNSFSAACEESCIADLNKDGKVDNFDIAILLGAWGPCK